jgi:excisionase family DNA binding protein
MYAPPFNVDQVAELLGCADTTVREHAKSGALPGLKFGLDWVFPAGALFARLDELAALEAARRRTATATPAPMPTNAPLAILHAMPPGRSRGRRTPPALPQMPGQLPQAR